MNLVKYEDEARYIFDSSQVISIERMSKVEGSVSSLEGLDKVLQDGQDVLGFAYLGIVGGLPVPYLVEGMFLRW